MQVVSSPSERLGCVLWLVGLVDFRTRPVQVLVMVLRTVHRGLGSFAATAMGDVRAGGLSLPLDLEMIS